MAFPPSGIGTELAASAVDAAMSSEENRAAGKDLMGFAREYVTMFYGEVEG